MSAPERRSQGHLTTAHEMALEATGSAVVSSGSILDHNHHRHSQAASGPVHHASSSTLVPTSTVSSEVNTAIGSAGAANMNHRTPTLIVGGTRHAIQGHEAFQQQIMHLKMQTQLQQQKLLEDYQVRQQQINEEYEVRLKLHLKELWEQQQAQAQQEERERRERAAETARRVGKQLHQTVSEATPSSSTGSTGGGTASSEVKQKLQVFLMKKRELLATNGGVAPPATTNNYRNWGVVKSSSGESLPISGGQVGASHPYRHPGHPTGMNNNIGGNNTHQQQNPALVGKYDANDFPLRKTASEPNLLKVRLKQRVIERRASPMARRHERLLANIKRKNIANCTLNNSPDSGPNSPPALTSRGSPTSAPIQEENEEGYGVLSGSQQGSLSDLSLFSSPSMPNISLGRPHHIPSDSPMLSTVSEAKVRAAFTARLGAPLTGQLLPGVLPYYPSLPVIEAEQQTGGGEPSPAVHHINYPTTKPITDTQVAHHHLNKIGQHRPLGRTQSAPLPLGHPMLNPGAQMAPMQYEDYGQPQSERHPMDHSLLKQHIRQTVLTRAAGVRQELQHRQLQQQQQQLLENIQSTNASSRINPLEVIDLTERTRHHSSGISDLDPADTEMTQTQIENSAYPRIAHTGQHIGARPLCRAVSSPLVHLGGGAGASVLHSSLDNEPPVNLSLVKLREFSGAIGGSPTTGLAYDNLMLKHACRCGDNSVHPEHGGRLQSVWARLMETGLVTRCERTRSRKASLEEIQSCHSEMHTLMFGTNPLSRQKLDMTKLSQLPIKSFVRLPCGGVGVDSDTTWNELHTGPAARMAAGCVIDLAFKTAIGDTRNGFAVVRPPGHHAEPEQAMGFCFFNSVAIAAALLKERAGLQRILIVDWDVHHGNGTQQIFYEDRQVLYLSIHRHDEGNFFPGTGGSTECGAGTGIGFNVNISWSGGLDPPLGDAEYLAAFRTIVMPIAQDFNPDIVLVSAGFDAAVGHPAPLGGYKVTPACFGHMTKELMTVANGKVVLSLEGGYDLPAICDSAQECVRALLGDEPSPIHEDELLRPPCQNAIDTLQKTIAIQLTHWPCIKRIAHTVCLSAVASSRKELEETDTVTAMAGLSMQTLNNNQTPERSRSVSVEPMEEDEGK